MKLKFLSYLLLAAFAMIFAPRSWWHEHESSAQHCDTEFEHSHSDVEENCFVCDFTLQPALVPLAFQFAFPKNNSFDQPIIAVQLAKTELISGYSLRGPPSL